MNPIKMFQCVNFCFSHRRIGVTSHQNCSTPISRTGSVPPLSIPARTFRLIPAKSYDGKIAQAIPPPPPYHASVRNAIHRNEINQITTQIQQSCSTNVFNVSASSSSTLTTNINAINASSSAVYVNRNSMKRLEKTGISDVEPNEQDQSNVDELATSNEFENDGETSSRGDGDDNDNELENNNETPTIEPTDKANEQQIQRPKQHNTTGEAMNDVTKKDSRFKDKSVIDSGAATAGAVSSASVTADDENANEKRTRGLKVLSNVQVSPNAILNVSLNSTNAETIPLNNMIFVSSVPSTSTGTTSQAVPTQLLRSQSLLKSLNELSHSALNAKYTKGNVEVSNNCDAHFSKFIFTTTKFIRSKVASTSAEKQKPIDKDADNQMELDPLALDDRNIRFVVLLIVFRLIVNLFTIIILIFYYSFFAIVMNVS